jgi:TonB family protein
MSSDSTLVFHYSGNGARGSDTAIPYRAITSFEYGTEVARHLGVVPAVAVGLVKHREVKHYFTIRFTDVSNLVQVGVFEVSKHDSNPLLQVLRARAPQACQTSQATCGGVKAGNVGTSLKSGSTSPTSASSSTASSAPSSPGPPVSNSPSATTPSQQGQTLIQPTIEHSVEASFGNCNALAHGRVVVTLDAVVNADGSPGDVRVLRSSGDACLDGQAVAAVKQYRFHPATRNGTPVSMHVTIATSFERM